MKSIGFGGIECDDIIHHFAKLLELMGAEVAICDDTGSYAVCGFPLTRPEKVRDRKGFILVNDGPDMEAFFERDYTCLICDLQPANARKIRDLLEEAGKPKIDAVILRDSLGDPRAGRYIMNLLDRTGEWINIENTPGDFVIRCGLQEGMGYRLKNLSKGMLWGLTGLSEALGLGSRKEAELAIGREKKRRWGKLSNSARASGARDM